MKKKIIAHFKGFESKKSPGPDGLKPITLKHLPHSMITSKNMIYKASIALHFAPTKWKSWGAAAYQLGNTSSRTITKVKQR